MFNLSIIKMQLQYNTHDLLLELSPINTIPCDQEKYEVDSHK